MPIEIKELVIKVNVSGEHQAAKHVNATPAKKDKEGMVKMAETISEQVLDIVKRKEER